MDIGVFLSASDLDERCTRPTRECGAHRWGRPHSGVGRIRYRADEGRRRRSTGVGGRLAGISVAFLRKWARKEADEMVFAKDLAERKARLLAVSGAVVVMPGGVGTLDEATEVLKLRKHGLGLYDEPVVLLNTAGFYDELKLQPRGGP
jgi:hypothetical protein